MFALWAVEPLRGMSVHAKRHATRQLRMFLSYSFLIQGRVGASSALGLLFSTSTMMAMLRFAQSKQMLTPGPLARVFLVSGVPQKLHASIPITSLA
jgi:hypothetical protein